MLDHFIWCGTDLRRIANTFASRLAGCRSATYGVLQGTLQTCICERRHHTYYVVCKQASSSACAEAARANLPQRPLVVSTVLGGGSGGSIDGLKRAATRSPKRATPTCQAAMRRTGASRPAACVSCSALWRRRRARMLALRRKDRTKLRVADPRPRGRGGHFQRTTSRASCLRSGGIIFEYISFGSQC